MSAAGSFNTTTLTLWEDAKVRALVEDARVLFVYLLTNRLRISEGFYALPVVLATSQLGWAFQRLHRAADYLTDSDLAVYDLAAEVVLIVKGLKHNPPRGAKSISAAVKKLETVQGAPILFDRFLASAEKYAPDFGAAIRVRYDL